MTLQNSKSSQNIKTAYFLSCLVTKSCLTLCDPMDCSPPGFSVHGILQARILKVGCHFLIQGIFLTQGSNLSLLHCRQILYHLSLQGSLTKTELNLHCYDPHSFTLVNTYQLLYLFYIKIFKYSYSGRFLESSLLFR